MSSNYNKHESKYFNTALLVHQALIILLETKDYNYITVKEICQKAGVNRSTFYLHYINIDDLLKEILDNSTKEFNKKLLIDNPLNINNEKVEDLIFITPRYLIPYLTYIKENKKLFLIAKSKPSLFNVDKMSEKAMKTIIFPVLNRFNVPNNEKKYLASFYISGVQAIIMEWVKNNCEEEIEYISNLIINYVLKGEDNSNKF